MTAAAKRKRDDITVNEAVREPRRKQVTLAPRPQSAIPDGAQPPGATGKRPNQRSVAVVQDEDTPMFPVTNLQDNLCCNKAYGAHRLIYCGSEIRQRGVRGYLYFQPDQGQYCWSYRPLGVHQAH